MKTTYHTKPPHLQKPSQRLQILLCSIIALKEALFLILAPFLPEQLREKSIPESLFAPLYSCYSVFLFVSSLYGGRIQSRVGRVNVIRIGLAMQVVSCGLFAILGSVQHKLIFCIIGFTGRIIEGIGAGLLQTAVYGELISQSGEDESKMVGLLEFSAVFGNLAGLLFSSLLSYLFGFTGPFLGIGLAFAIYFVIIGRLKLVKHQGDDYDTAVESHLNGNGQRVHIELSQASYLQGYQRQRQNDNILFDSDDKGLLMNSIQMHHIDDHSMRPHGGGGGYIVEQSITNFNHRLLNGTLSAHPPVEITYLRVLKIKRSIFGFLSLTLSLTLWTFTNTTLANKLQGDFGLTSEIVSLIYSIQMAGFLFTSLFVHKALNQYVGFIILIASLLVQSLGVAMIGPSNLLSGIIPNELRIICLGLLFLGMANSYSSIVSYSEMNDAVMEFYPNCDREKLNDTLAGLYNAGFSLGTIIGPIMGSYITIYSGSFSVCADFFSIGTVAFCMVLGLAVYYPLARKEKIRNRLI
ncbi:hypothetical protein FGO68_gene7182 [Halteria grandinella]|uniref:Major facilitator superfamily (MFS) profile domain-containing protein n=1 Tax=Halteria grandinella TaxID=5974 RepID=A0A8J8NRA7_HALGN|nr:hypothetical protein FGO68_gene7182 [Halteria grandinella]